MFKPLNLLCAGLILNGVSSILQPFGLTTPAGIQKPRALIENILKLLWSAAYIPSSTTTANPNEGDKLRFVFSPHWGWRGSYKARASGGKIKLRGL